MLTELVSSEVKVWIAVLTQRNDEAKKLNEETALSVQEELLENCLPLVFQAFDSACEAKIRNPVVFLLDCEDPLGGEIAKGWLGEQVVQEAIEDFHSTTHEDSQGTTTVFAHAFSWEESQREVPGVFPYLGPVFSEGPPADGFLAITVAAGGASAFTVPSAARETNN